ncbi:MAG: hypothetical protein LBG73_07810 [Spirochaetaceae bacterium]|jgi:hypothetical protein|nr:hypothetical protein [Spirochaetaceae bacterium]
MKKLALFVLLSVAAGGILFAQTATPTTIIQGTVGLSNGSIAVTSGGVTYYVKRLERYIGFIDALKIGAPVMLEGYASAPSVEGQTYRYFYPIKLTIVGTTYEVGAPITGGRDPFAGGIKDKGNRRR